MEVLNCKVSPTQLSRWVDWLAPDRQPFYVTAKQLKAWKLQQDDTEPDRQLRDTYRSYSLDSRLRSVWLDEAAFMSLPRATRAGLVRAQADHGREAVPSVRRWRGMLGDEIKAQADGHRFVWWKSLLRSHAAEVLPHIVSEDLQPSRHREVRSWPTNLLPQARALAGTWSGSGTSNCFGTVTLGAGYMFHKPSQAWSSPRKVRTVSEVRRSIRTAGWHLERHTLLG